MHEKHYFIIGTIIRDQRISKTLKSVMPQTHYQQFSRIENQLDNFKNVSYSPGILRGVQANFTWSIHDYQFSCIY